MSRRFQPQLKGRNKVIKANYTQTSLSIVAIIVLLSGCSLAPRYVQSLAPLAVDCKPQDVDTAAGGAQAQEVESLDWRMFVGDSFVRQLVEMALQNNRNLRQTLLNVKAARGQFRIQRADRLLGVDIQVGGVRQRNPVDGATGLLQVQSAWQAGAGGTVFDLDLFGRVRNLSEAALEEYLSTEDAAHAIHISLVAEVIQAYITRDDALQRQTLTVQKLRSREVPMQLMARRLKAGTSTALDYQDAAGLTEQAKADLERIDRELHQVSNALDLLVG